MTVTLKSFPFDSMNILNEESGKMEPDRQYEAEIFRRYFAKFLSNGVYYGHYKNYGENSMKVSSDGGLNIKVSKGAGIIEGADFENEEDQIFILERPSTGERLDRVVVRLDKTLAKRNIYLDVKQGDSTNPATLQRDENIYEICIAEITVKSSSNIESSDVVDKRLDSTLCGLVNSLISVDGEELYKRFQEYIDSVINELVRKDEENIVFAGTIKDSKGGTSKNDFTDEYKNKLDYIETEANKTVINNTLTSTSTKEALSAAMGNKLNKEKQKKITCGTEPPSGGVDGDLYVQFFE